MKTSAAKINAGISTLTGIQTILILFLQEMENKIRNTLNEIYFGKTKDIVNGLRSITPLESRLKQEALRNDLVAALSKRPQAQ